MELLPNQTVVFITAFPQGIGSGVFFSSKERELNEHLHLIRE
jgi:hypothetical protein